MASMLHHVTIYSSTVGILWLIISMDLPVVFHAVFHFAKRDHQRLWLRFLDVENPSRDGESTGTLGPERRKNMPIFLNSMF